MDHSMEYPFGFGFALMENPDAMARFSTMSEEEKRQAFRYIEQIDSPREMQKFLEALGRGEEIPTPKKKRKSKRLPHP